MSDPFVEHPILNSPYAYPRPHWGPNALEDEDLKGDDRKDAKEKKVTMDSYWVPGFRWTVARCPLHAVIL